MGLKILVTDIEGNNLYEGITRFWCAWTKDPVTGEKKGFRPHQFYEYIDHLATADVLVFHNGVDFDIPALIKLGAKKPPRYMFDTLVLSRILNPDKLGGHSLKAWGKELGVLKGTYGEQEDAWDAFTESMFVYCEDDVEVTDALYKHLCELAGFDYANPPLSFLDFRELFTRFSEVFYECENTCE